MAQTGNTQGNSSRAQALARRKALSGSGKAALQSRLLPVVDLLNRVRLLLPSTVLPAPGKVVAGNSRSAGSSSSRAASLARRRAMSTKGKQR